MKKILTDLISKIKKIKTEYFVVIALAIVALILVFNAFSSDKKESECANEVDSYVCGLENKLGACLKKVKGAGDVKVIISVASGKEQVIATESKNGGDGVYLDPITVGGKPFVYKENYPMIVGVVIVADGADKLSVKMDLLSAARVFLDIDESKIKVLSA